MFSYFRKTKTETETEIETSQRMAGGREIVKAHWFLHSRRLVVSPGES